MSGPTLEETIRHAVSRRLSEVASDDGWRSYLGPWTELLKSDLMRIFGATHCEPVCSGTTALELLLRGANVTAGDEVMLAGYDYPGTFSAIERIGARPVLVDIDREGWGLSIEGLDAAYRPECKVLILSHLHGQLQAIDLLSDWCRRRSVKLIQDACQSIGASYMGRPLAAWSDAVIVSFGGGKVLSAGRGGAWLTNDAQWAQHAKIASGAGSGAYEMSQLQAAVVTAQLPYLDRIVQACRDYFSAMGKSMAEILPGYETVWKKDIGQTAFYQAGWRIPSSSIEFLSQLDENASSCFGSGFPGFHRRSPRRCRIGTELIQSAAAAAETVTVHYSVGVGERISADELARLLAKAICLHQGS